MLKQRWLLPSISEVLDNLTAEESRKAEAHAQTDKIERSLAEFGIEAQVRDVRPGPKFIRFGLKPGSNTQISQIKKLEQDLNVVLKGQLVALEDPSPAYPYLSFVIENYKANIVQLRRVLEAPQFNKMTGAIKIGLGIDTSGQAVVIDLATLPHLLLGGTSGSGKSSCIQAMIVSLLCTYPPDTVQFVMIDPLQVELENSYSNIPHLLWPILTDTNQVLQGLQDINEEIEARYKQLTRFQVRDITAYNSKLTETGQKKMPYLVVIIDNLFDLMMWASKDVEKSITPISRKARAAGVHLILATLRSNVKIVAGSIKANFPARIAFRTADHTDSRLILDKAGAEKLTGPGDMLYRAPHSNDIQRVQGAYVSEQEIKRVVDYWRQI